MFWTVGLMKFVITFMWKNWSHFLVFEETTSFLTLYSCYRRNVALIKSDKDNRYGLDSVVTHDGTKMECWAISQLSSFHEKLGIQAYDKV
jgi:thymidine kinase